MNLKRKMRRYLRLSTFQNKVEIQNNNVIKTALKNKDASVKILHATNGYRNFSLSRMEYMGGIPAMWKIISGVIEKCQQ